MTQEQLLAWMTDMRPHQARLEAHLADLQARCRDADALNEIIRERTASRQRMITHTLVALRRITDARLADMATIASPARGAGGSGGGGGGGGGGGSGGGTPSVGDKRRHPDAGGPTAAPPSPPAKRHPPRSSSPHSREGVDGE
jgi:hypothetical protein